MSIFRINNKTRSIPSLSDGVIYQEGVEGDIAKPTKSTDFGTIREVIGVNDKVEQSAFNAIDLHTIHESGQGAVSLSADVTKVNVEAATYTLHTIDRNVDAITDADPDFSAGDNVVMVSIDENQIRFDSEGDTRLGGGTSSRWGESDFQELIPLARLQAGPGEIGAEITSNTIAFIDSNPDTITDSNNQFLTQGFYDNAIIEIAGGANNTLRFTIDTVTAGIITLVGSDNVVPEVAGNNITIKTKPRITRIRDDRYFHTSVAFRTWLELAVGTLYEKGGKISENTTNPRQLDQSAGNLFDKQMKRQSLSLQQSIAAITVTSTAVTGISSPLIVSNSQYDNNGTLDNIPQNRWVSHTILKSPKGETGGTPEGGYVFVYGTETFQTEIDAATYAVESYGVFGNQTSGQVAIAKIIIQEGVNNIGRIIDIRPRIGGV